MCPSGHLKAMAIVLLLKMAALWLSSGPSKLIFRFFQSYATILPKNHPRPHLLPKGIDVDSFSG